MATRNYYTSVVMGSAGGFPLDLVTSVNCKAAYSTRQLSLADPLALEALSSSSGLYQDFSGSDVEAGSLLTFAAGADVSARKFYDQSGNGKTVTCPAGFFSGLIVAGVPKTLSGKQAAGGNVNGADSRPTQDPAAATTSYFGFMGGGDPYDMVFVSGASASVPQATLAGTTGNTPLNGPRVFISGGVNVNHQNHAAGTAIINNLQGNVFSGTLNVLRVTQNAGAATASGRSIIEVNNNTYANNSTTGSPSGIVGRGPGFFCNSQGGDSFGKLNNVYNEMYVFDGVMTAQEWLDLKDNISNYYA
jgi:hypothetical protein